MLPGQNVTFRLVTARTVPTGYYYEPPAGYLSNWQWHTVEPSRTGFGTPNVPVPVPEPTVIVGVAFGFSALGLRRRRR